MHTPGPWEVVLLSGTGGPYAIRMQYNEQKTYYGVREIVDGANARLIAAAPTLLEALQDCLLCLESPSKLQGDAIRAARAAIAKAEGK